jgi:TPR repeat protein
MMEAIELQDFAEGAGYQIETNANGVFTIGDEKMIAFVMDMANDGNKEAQLVLARYFLTNECTDEQKTQAIAWLQELAANGNEDAQDILEDLE